MTTEAATNDNITPIKLGSLTNFQGVCPICRRQDNFYALECTLWGFCDAHHVKWKSNSYELDRWLEMTPEERFMRIDKLAGYREVESFELLKHGTAEELAAYHAGVAEVERIAASSGFTVDITPWRDITDPRELAERAAMADEEIPF